MSSAPVLDRPADRPHALPARAPRPRLVARWLLVVAALVLAMVVVGGITRLTESGLSMVHWDPVSGAIPPLGHAQWQAEFDAYRTSPQFLKINRAMTLDGFKTIFFWEYLHRLLGRLIGLAFAGVFGWLWWRRAIPRGYGWRLAGLFALGGLQGLVGWIMVASGLQDAPHVSHLLLAVHLLDALLLLAALLWTALDLFRLAAEPGARPARLRGLAVAALGVLTVQLMLGAFTAGLDAGFAFNSWPLMGATLFPAGGWRPDLGVLANLSSNPIVVQFIHRWWAWATAAAVLTLAWRAGQAGAGWALPLTGGLVALQIALGVATLLTGVLVPVAALHQLTGTLLLGGVILVAHRLGTMKVS